MTLAALTALTGVALAQLSETPPSAGPEVPFVTTPVDVVDEMLRIARVGPDDVVFDLGSGDGRIVIRAAQRHGARGVGVEIDGRLVAVAREAAAAAGVSDRVEFREQDLFGADLRDATVVTLFLFRRINEELRPKLLAELRPGARIVSHQFDLGDEWKPDRTVTFNGRKLFLWVVPEGSRRRGADRGARPRRPGSRRVGRCRPLARRPLRQRGGKRPGDPHRCGAPPSAVANVSRARSDAGTGEPVDDADESDADVHGHAGRQHAHDDADADADGGHDAADDGRPDDGRDDAIDDGRDDAVHGGHDAGHDGRRHADDADDDGHADDVPDHLRDDEGRDDHDLHADGGRGHGGHGRALQRDERDDGDGHADDGELQRDADDDGHARDALTHAACDAAERASAGLRRTPSAMERRGGAGASRAGHRAPSLPGSLASFGPGARQRTGHAGTHTIQNGAKAVGAGIVRLPGSAARLRRAARKLARSITAAVLGMGVLTDEAGTGQISAIADRMSTPLRNGVIRGVIAFSARPF